MTEKDYKKLVESISKKPENLTCVDCNSKNPKWVSARYGTFMCLDCAGVHRSLGVYLDFIKSIGLDTWDRESYLPVKYGGNSRFKEYLVSQEINDLDINEKYQNSKIIEYSKILMEDIKKQTGQNLKSAENTTKSSIKGSAKDYRKINNESIKESNQSVAEEKIYNHDSGNLRSSISSIGSVLTRHAKTLTEKTMVYGSKIGLTVAGHAKNLVSASSDAISNIRKSKTEEKKQSTFILKPKDQSKNNDWS